MTSQEWLDKARRGKLALIQLIQDFHPALPHTVELPMTITAPRAEEMRQRIVKHMAKDYDPVALFNKALDASDVSTVTSVLNRAWFGVPESLDCWSMTGFKEAVDLLDEPPEDV